MSGPERRLKQIDADSSTDAEGISVGDDVVAGVVAGFVTSALLLFFFDLAGCVVVVTVVGHSFWTSAVNIGMTGTRRSTPGACASMAWLLFPCAWRDSAIWPYFL